jgi:SH3-like domain-containing protein
MRARAALATLALAVSGAAAADFRTVEENVAVLYDAPSRAATRLFVVSRHYPLEVIVNLDAWVKVRDHTGALAWIEAKAFGARRMVLVTGNAAEARVRPDEAAPLAFVAAQYVALELVEIAPAGWLRVRAADGADGYVRSSQVWGT